MCPQAEVRFSVSQIASSWEQYWLPRLIIPSNRGLFETPVAKFLLSEAWLLHELFIEFFSLWHLLARVLLEWDSRTSDYACALLFWRFCIKEIPRESYFIWCGTYNSVLDQWILVIIGCCFNQTAIWWLSYGFDGYCFGLWTHLQMDLQEIRTHRLTRARAHANTHTLAHTHTCTHAHSDGC